MPWTVAQHGAFAEACAKRSLLLCRVENSAHAYAEWGGHAIVNARRVFQLDGQLPPKAKRKLAMSAELEMACHINGLFEPSTRISAFVPDFFPLMATMRDPRTLTIALYFRSTKSEAVNQNATDEELEASVMGEERSR